MAKSLRRKKPNNSSINKKTTSNCSVCKANSNFAASNKTKTHCASSNKSTSYNANNKSAHCRIKSNAISCSRIWTALDSSRTTGKSRGLQGELSVFSSGPTVT